MTSVAYTMYLNVLQTNLSRVHTLLTLIGRRLFFIRGAFVKFVAWHHNSKMLSNNTFLETRIQWLLEGLIFVEKGHGLHVQHVQSMLKMSRGLYTGANFKQYLEKTKENWAPYLRS